MKNFLIYSTAVFVGIILAFTMLFVLAHGFAYNPHVPASLQLVFTAYIPFFAYYIHKQKTSFFDRMK